MSKITFPETVSSNSVEFFSETVSKPFGFKCASVIYAIKTITKEKVLYLFVVNDVHQNLPDLSQFSVLNNWYTSAVHRNK